MNYDPKPYLGLYRLVYRADLTMNSLAGLAKIPLYRFVTWLRSSDWKDNPYGEQLKNTVGISIENIELSMTKLEPLADVNPSAYLMVCRNFYEAANRDSFSFGAILGKAMLDKGLTYTNIYKNVKINTHTIGRVCVGDQLTEPSYRKLINLSPEFDLYYPIRGVPGFCGFGTAIGVQSTIRLLLKKRIITHDTLKDINDPRRLSVYANNMRYHVLPDYEERDKLWLSKATAARNKANRENNQTS